MIASRFGFIVAAIALGGCHAAISPAPPSGLPNASTFDGAGSWVKPQAKQEALVYGSDAYVFIYTYAGELVGELEGFPSDPRGLCSDQYGDVYVTAGGEVYEYQRYGSLPVNVIDDSPEGANSCAVDPTTGNLALANSGNVAIFPPGSFQYPTSYTNPNITSYSFCGYDSEGNLYVDGTGAKNSFQFAELRHGSSTLTSIPLTGLNNSKHRAGGVQWDGQDVAVADGLSHAIYRVAVSGSSGKVVQTIHLSPWRSHGVVEFYIQGKRLLFPWKERVFFFDYPKGGRPKNGFNDGHEIEEITVSLPQS